MKKESKIYTKTGDKGFTSLIGGERVPKYDNRIEAYGTVDELNSWIGLIRDQDIDENLKNVLSGIQNALFVMETQLAKGRHISEKMDLPQVTRIDVGILEKEIDRMEKDLPPLHSFIRPGGNTIASYCHIARTVCRRTERLIVKIAEKYSVDCLNIQYINRLSDYLFVLSRKITKDLGYM